MTGRINCGFARVFLWETKAKVLSDIKKHEEESLAAYKNRVLNERFVQYVKQFGNYEKLQLDKAAFLKSYKSIDSKISQWRNPTEKHSYIGQFSSVKWSKTSEVRKKFHSLQDCQCCNAFHFHLASSFPENKKYLSKKKSPLQEVINNTKSAITNKKALPSNKEFKEIGKQIFSEIDKSCKENLGKSFTEIIEKTPESNLVRRKSPSEKRKETKKIQKDFKAAIEGHWEKNDAISHLAQRTSFVKRNQQRLNQSFETIDEAKQRIEKTPPNLKRSHIASEIHGETQQLLEDVKSWPSNKLVNWSEMARKYKIRGAGNDVSPPNAGQMLKEFLKAEGVDVTQFPSKYEGKTRVRRSLKKQPGGWVSVPVSRSNKKIKLDIKESVASGKLDLGIPVVESEHNKHVLTAEGNIEKKSFTVSARKYPLKQIAKKSIKQNKEFLRIKSEEAYDEMNQEDLEGRLKVLHEETRELTKESMKRKLKKCERTRHWLTWHDHSSIAGSGFMLYMVRELYDPALYLTPQEHKAISGQDVDIQSLVETPQLYIMGASSAKDADQLAFTPTRQECLKEFKHTEASQGETQVEIEEKMKFMNGDNPAIECEDGTQKGGHFGCAGCQGDMRRAWEYDYMGYQKYLNLEEKRNLVLDGKFGKSYSMTPFKKLKVNEIKQELKARKIPFQAESTKKDLQEKLTLNLRGTSRVPALLFGREDFSLKELNITDYEVLFFEPLHTCLNHISNIITEMPLHMTNIDALIAFKEITSLALNKDKLRATDYRKALLKLTISLTKQDLLNEHERNILLLFCEMMSMYYENDEKRSPRSALRLHNISFQHGQAIQEQLTPPKAMTLRKLCGIYYHSAVDHAPLLYRIVCLKSISAELFERFFDRIEDITRKTWNKQLNDLVPNAFLHVQAEDQVANQKSSFVCQEREISQLAKGLPKPKNTIVSKEMMTKHSRLWQSHLARIPDYLLAGPNVWWKWREDGSVEFLDSNSEQNTQEEPPLYPFRSNSIKDVKQKLQDAWEQCQAMPHHLPLYKLRDTDGKVVYERNREENEQEILVEELADNQNNEEVFKDGREEEDDEEVMDSEDDNEEIMDGEDDEEVIDGEDDEEMDREEQDEEYKIISYEGEQYETDIVDGEEQDDEEIMKGEEQEEECKSIMDCQEQGATDEGKCGSNAADPTTKNQLESASPLRTKTAKAIAAVIGVTSDVRELDRLKLKIAENPKSYYYYKNYDILLTKLQTQILQQLRISQERLKELNKLTNEISKGQEYEALMKKKKIALKLLQTWNITVHI